MKVVFYLSTFENLNLEYFSFEACFVLLMKMRVFSSFLHLCLGVVCSCIRIICWTLESEYDNHCSLICSLIYPSHHNDWKFISKTLSTSIPSSEHYSKICGGSGCCPLQPTVILMSSFTVVLYLYDHGSSRQVFVLCSFLDHINNSARSLSALSSEISRI